jgi:radical SAM protein with 4Fe4S-binding SPASM domain
MRVVALDYVGYYLDDRFIPLNQVKWMPLAGKPYIWHVMERLKNCTKVDEVVLFTQDTLKNRHVIHLAKELGLNLNFIEKPLRFEESLRRYRKFNAEIIIKIDNLSPLFDPKIIDSMVEYFVAKDLDILRDFGVGVVMVKSNLPSKIYEFEKNKEIAKKSWLDVAENRKDLFKSDTFGNFAELEFLSRNPQKNFIILKKIYERFYKNGEIIDLNEVLSSYRKEPEWLEVLFYDQIEIELTNDCNLVCIMCPRQRMTRPIGYMDFELYKKIIDESIGMNVIFSLFGEPLMHPDFLKMIDYAKGGKVNITLYTNALNLNEEISTAILENHSITTIFFSLDAATPQTYRRIKGSDEYEKVIQNIHRFLKMRREKILKLKDIGYQGDINPIVALQILKMKENDHEIEEFWSRWSQKEKIERMLDWRKRRQEIEERLKSLREEVDGLKRGLNWREKFTKKPEELKNTEKKLEIERQRLSESLDKLWHKTFYENCDLPIEYVVIGHFNNYCNQIEDRSVVDVTPLKRIPCKQLKAGISVLWNGDIVFCRQDVAGKYPLGNLKEQTLTDILKSKKLEEIWQAHKDGEYNKLPLCANCKEWYYNLYA